MAQCSAQPERAHARRGNPLLATTRLLLELRELDIGQDRLLEVRPFKPIGGDGIGQLERAPEPISQMSDATQAPGMKQTKLLRVRVVTGGLRERTGECREDAAEVPVLRRRGRSFRQVAREVHLLGAAQELARELKARENARSGDQHQVKAREIRKVAQHVELIAQHATLLRLHEFAGLVDEQGLETPITSSRRHGVALEDSKDQSSSAWRQSVSFEKALKLRDTARKAGKRCGQRAHATPPNHDGRRP